MEQYLNRQLSKSLDDPLEDQDQSFTSGVQADVTCILVKQGQQQKYRKAQGLVINPIYKYIKPKTE